MVSTYLSIIYLLDIICEGTKAMLEKNQSLNSSGDRDLIEFVSRLAESAFDWQNKARGTNLKLKSLKSLELDLPKYLAVANFIIIRTKKQF